MRFAEAARAAPGEHVGATKRKAAVVERPHIHSLLRDVWKIDQDCVGFASGADDRKLSILKGLAPLFGHEPSHNIIQHSQDAAAQKPICCIRAPPWQAGPSLFVPRLFNADTLSTTWQRLTIRKRRTRDRRDDDDPFLWWALSATSTHGIRSSCRPANLPLFT